MSFFKKQVSLHGLRAYLSTGNRHVTKDAYVTGGEASVGRKGGNVVVPGSPSTVALFEDFLASDTGQYNGWTRVNSDVDTGASNSVARQSMTNGVMRVSFQGTPLNAPTGAVGLVQSHGGIKNWKPNQGRLHFAARVKLPSLASVNAFIGLSDSGGSEVPAYDTGGGVITQAADAIGFMYSNLGSSSTNWQGVSARSVAADSGDQTVTSSVTPVANTYDVLEIYMGDSGENATFAINGSPIGRLTNPVEAKSALAPGVWVFGSDTGTIQVDVDWVAVSANRDTGT